MLTFPYLKRKSEFKQLGIRTSVIKPFNPAELSDAIQVALDKKTSDSQRPQKVIEAKPKTAARALKILVAVIKRKLLPVFATFCIAWCYFINWENP